MRDNISYICCMVGHSALANPKNEYVTYSSGIF